jgi:hypothetical protein
MIKRTLMVILCSIPILGFSQNLRVGIANIYEEKFSFAEIITLDGIIISEGNKVSTSSESLFLGYEYTLSDKFKVSQGFQYSYNSISLMVDVPLPDDFPTRYSSKFQTISIDNFEFPLEVSFVLFETGKVGWKIRAGMVPVISSSSITKYEEVPEGPDWSTEAVDALNAAETIPKSFYMNYQYGLGVEYGKFELSLFQSANLSRSISQGYTLYGNTYPFDRRIRSTRIGLFYSFGLKKKNKE